MKAASPAFCDGPRMELKVQELETTADVEPGITVTGAGAGAEIEVRATATDLDGGHWESSAVFTASDEGVVDLATDDPVRGSWSVADPIGLLWSLAPADGGEGNFAVAWEGFEVEVSASESDGDPVTATLKRRFAAEGVERSEIDHEGMVATLFIPAGPGPHPGVAMYHGSGGGVTGFEPSGALMASHGYAVLAVGWFGAGDTPKSIRRVPVESLRRGVDFLLADDRIDSGRIGVLGTSAGGEAIGAMLANSPDLNVAAGVSIAGSSVAWQALVDGRPPKESRFTLAGKDVPWAPVDVTKMFVEMAVKNPIRKLRHKAPQLHTLAAYESGYKSKEAAGAAFGLEVFDGPMLLMAGAEDEVWPSPVMAKAIAARRGDRPDDKVVIFPGTGHISLRPPGLPTTVLRSGDLVFGGQPQAFSDAIRTAWIETLSHFESGLAAPG